MAVRHVVLVLLLGSLASAQYFKETQDPKKPQARPPVYPRPSYPKQPEKPAQPKIPPSDQKKPSQPQKPQKPSNPEFNTCEVEANYKIPCGPAGITAVDCSSINCCFDGQMCYYGKAVTLQCTKDGQFIIVVARDATLPHIDLESINFLGADPNCKPVGTTSAFAIYQFPVTACGTTYSEENDVITYENRLSSSYEVAVGPYGSITRDSQFDLLVQCRYTGSTVVALVIDVGGLPAPPAVAGPGPAHVELRLGNGQCTMKGCAEEDVAFNSYYLENEYPITKVLRDPVYVEVRLQDRTDPNLVLTLGRCWATASPYPQSMPQWDLLINGCPYRDDRYQTALIPVTGSAGLPNPSHYRRFVFKMFTFVAPGTGSTPGKQQNLQHDGVMTPLHEMVYIHCNTAVCTPSAQNNCEPRCNRKKRDIAASLKSVSRQEFFTVTSHGIIFTDQSQEQSSSN